MPETIRLSDFPLEKCIPCISLKALKEQISKMADIVNIEAPDSSSSTPATARNFKISA